MSFQDFGFGLLYQRATDPASSAVNVGSRGRSPGRTSYEPEYADISMKKQIFFPDPPGTRRRSQSNGRRKSSTAASTNRQQNMFTTSSSNTSAGRVSSPSQGTNMGSTPTLIESRSSRSSGRRNSRASSLSRYHSNNQSAFSSSGLASPTPALTTRCPVTERLLLEDSSVSGAVTDDSVDHSSAMVESRNSQSPSFLLDDVSATMDDDGGLRQYNSRSRSDTSRGRGVPSIYSHLTSEIVNFQVRTATSKYICHFVVGVELNCFVCA